MAVKIFSKQLVTKSKIMVFICRVVPAVDHEISLIHFISYEKYMPSFHSHLSFTA